MLSRSHALLLFIVLLTLLIISSCSAGGSDNNTNNSISTSPSANNNSNAPSNYPPKIKNDLSVMVLGSGGPVPMISGRANAGYLVFVGKEPKILMDVGGGTYQRLAESGINIKDLDIVLLSHLHADHTDDLSAFIKAIYFQSRAAGTFRTAPIRIFGPDSNGIPFPPAVFPDATAAQYPANSEFIDGLYNIDSGIFRYLNIFTRAIRGGIFDYIPNNISPIFIDNPIINTILNENGLVIKAVGVKHGPVPALAFRIEYGGRSIVYSGDTNSETDNMINLAMNTNVLIYDTAILDDVPDPAIDPVFFQLHTTPTRIGQVAAAANPYELILSHLTPNTEPNIATIISTIRAQGYPGEISVAKDLYLIDD